jgi:DNA polymerase III alpha subunit (gram-positive type)
MVIALVPKSAAIGLLSRPLTTSPSTFCSRAVSESKPAAQMFKFHPHLFDTLDMTRRLYPTCPSHSLEHVVTRLNVVNGAAHRVLVDACLVKEIFLTML